MYNIDLQKVDRETPALCAAVVKQNDMYMCWIQNGKYDNKRVNSFIGVLQTKDLAEATVYLQ